MSKFFFSCHKIHILFHRQYCGRKEDPFQGPRMGSCLTLGNKLPEEIHVLTKQETLLGRGAWAESRRVREPGELLSSMDIGTGISSLLLTFSKFFRLVVTC